MTKTYVQEMIETKKGMTMEEIFKSKEVSSCIFSEDTIRKVAILELNKKDKDWSELEVSNFVKVVESYKELWAEAYMGHLINAIGRAMSDDDYLKYNMWD